MPWPSGQKPVSPDNPAAWLTAVAKRKAVDAWRRAEMLDERYRTIARGLPDAEGRGLGAGGGRRAPARLHGMPSRPLP